MPRVFRVEPTIKVELVELGLTFERRQGAVVGFPSELKLHFVFLERIG